ncbi:MAG: inositol monophosphatase [Alphaproteobacteria bacterium]
MTSPDPQTVAAIVREVAETVVLPRFRALEAHEIHEKGPGDLVTIADRESEAALARRLTDLLPGSLVVGEEAAAADGSVLAHLSDDRPVWVIDPVDGTHNFAHGDPTFALILALVEGGATRRGWIYLPIDREMAIAEQGGGAWIDGSRMAVDQPERLDALVGGVTYSLFAPMPRETVKARCAAFRQCRNLRCAGREYVDMSRGRRHFSFMKNLKPWDHAAGVLMHREAGGYAARAADETPYRLVDPGIGLLVAPNRDLWHRIRDHFNGV